MRQLLPFLCLMTGCGTEGVAPRGQTSSDGATDPAASGGDGSDLATDSGINPPLAGDGGATDGAAPPPDLAAVVDLAVAHYSTVVINFDDLSNQTIVTNQYAAHATFSADPGSSNEALNNYDFKQSPPNYLTTYFTSQNRQWNTYVDFTRPVRNLSFRGIGINSNGKAADIRIFQNGSYTQTVDLNGNGDWTHPPIIDLSAYPDITRIEVVNITDEEDIGYDDITFSFPD